MNWYFFHFHIMWTCRFKSKYLNVNLVACFCAVCVIRWHWFLRVLSSSLVRWDTTSSTAWKTAPSTKSKQPPRRPTHMPSSLNWRMDMTQVQTYDRRPDHPERHCPSDNSWLSLYFVWADLGECGDKLSNGQKHSIAIIRALVRDPHVVILDETTGKVDAEVWHAVSKIHLGNCHLNPKATALLHSIRKTLWCKTNGTYRLEFI